VSKQQPGWRVIRGRVPVERLAEYERVMAMLPEGVPVTLDMIRGVSPTPARLRTPDPLQPRRPGRPGWTEPLFDQRLRDALKATKEPHTNARIAANFRSMRADDPLGLDPDYFGSLRRRRVKRQLPPE
jgi:hypothetical protein